MHGAVRHLHVLVALLEYACTELLCFLRYDEPWDDDLRVLAAAAVNVLHRSCRNDGP